MKDNSGYAFPTHAAYDNTPGMSLRDYFAAQALVGLLAFSPDGTDADGQLNFEDASLKAYLYADAMIVARNF